MPQRLNNPITFGSIPELLLAVLNVIIVVAIPLIILYLIYAGFKYVAARGNPEAIQEANRSLLYGLIGAVVIIGSFAILEIINNLVGEFG